MASYNNPKCTDCNGPIGGGAEHCRFCGGPICARCASTGPGGECRRCAETLTVELEEALGLGAQLLQGLAQAGAWK